MLFRFAAAISLAFAVPALLCNGLAGAQSTDKVSVGTSVPTLAKYQANDDKPRGLSGMACLAEKPAAGGGGDLVRECVAIIDEESFAEIAILSEKGLKPTGSTVELSEAKPDITGAQRVAPCKKADKDFGEFDGEGIAIADGYVYFTGSHSCSGKNKYKPSSYLLARFKHSSATSFLDGNPAVERTWRGADMLLNSPVKDSYGAEKGKGTNIEGLAVTGGRLYVGLRTPVGGNEAYILSAPVAKLFASGQQPLDANSVKPISLKLGEGTGIRDLAALQSGGLLILSGPTIEQEEIPYRIWHLPPPLDPNGAGLTELAIIKSKAVAKKGLPKAESITVLQESPATKKITVLVNYDNIDEGAPARHELTLKP
jgi:Protein of unknown function (DUF3616)